MTEQEELEYLKQNSPMALPDDPSSSGWSAAQIKEKHYAGLFFLYNLFKANRENLNQAVSDMQEIVDSINAEYDEIINGKNVSAKWDDENNEIKTTYAKIINITNGTIKVLKYIKENGTDDYIYNIEKNLSTLTTNFNTLKAWTDNLKDINSDTSVLRAVQATKDGLGNIINETYATIASLTLVNSSISNIVNGTTIVGKAYNDQLGRRIDTTYIRIADIINVLNDTSTNKPLSAAMGKSLQDQINAINTLLASDDTDLDTIQEIITYIKNNKTLIENITSDKMSYSVLVHNLTTNNDNLPLSASMGYVLKGYIDTLNDAETGIQANEAQRILNENQRIANEEARQTGYSGFDSRITANTNAISGIKNGTNLDSFSDVESALAAKANTSDVYAKSEVYTKTEAQALHTDTLNSSKSYTDKRIDDLEWQMGTYNYDVDTDNNVARIKTLPSDTYKSMVDYIGGKSVKYNQLVKDSNFESQSGWTSWNYGNSFVVSNNECRCYGKQNLDISRGDVSIISGHKYFVFYDIKGNSSSTNTFARLGSDDASGYTSITTTYASVRSIITATSNASRFYLFAYGSDANNEVYFRKVIIVDLTLNYGAGNEPSDVATAIPLLKANGYKLDGTDTYSTGSLKHAITTSVNFLPINLLDNTTFVKGRVDNGVIGYANETTSLTITDTGVTFTTSSNYRGVASGLIKLIPDANYCISYDAPDGVYADMYDINENWISRATLNYVSSGKYTFTTAINCAFIRISFQKATIGTTTISNIMLVKGSTAPSTFIPYVAPITKAIPSQVLALVTYGMGFSILNLLENKFYPSGYYTFTGNENWTYRNQGTNCDRYVATISNLGGKPNATSSLLVVGFENGNAYSEDKSNLMSIDNNNIYITVPIGVNPNTLLTNGTILLYELASPMPTDVSQYFTPDWNKADLDKQYATCEMVVAEPIDMPNSITNLIKEVKA